MTPEHIAASVTANEFEALEFKAIRPTPRSEGIEREVSNCGCPMRI